MAQPTRRHKVIKETNNGIKGTGEGIKYCNECPFLLSDTSDGTIKYVCAPNDYIFEGYADKDAKIVVPKWCANKKKNIIEKFFDEF